MSAHTQLYCISELDFRFLEGLANKANLLNPPDIRRLPENQCDI
jgi:hypothetical protein